MPNNNKTVTENKTIVMAGLAEGKTTRQVAEEIVNTLNNMSNAYTWEESNYPGDVIEIHRKGVFLALVHDVLTPNVNYKELAEHIIKNY